MAGRPRTELRTQVYDIWCNLQYIAKHQQPGRNGCVEWTAGKHRQGYGMTGAWQQDHDHSASCAGQAKMGSCSCSK